MGNIEWLIKNGYTVTFSGKYESDGEATDLYLCCNITKCLSSDYQDDRDIKNAIECDCQIINKTITYNFQEWNGNRIDKITSKIDKLVTVLQRKS